MPKHLLRRYLPDPEKILRIKGLGFLGHRLRDPSLWHLNRRSAAGAMFWGLWCAFLPMPFQSLPAAAAAILFRVNLPLCIVLVWLSNPLTLFPLLIATYVVGCLLLGMPLSTEVDVSQAWFLNHAEPLLLGTLVTGFALACLGYIGMRLFWRWHVVRAWERRMLRQRHHQPPISSD